MKIRAARPGERAAIAKFCLSQDPEDYIPAWMDRFERQGRFFMLQDGRRLAGIVHGQRAPDGSAWMSAARVHEDYRGQGWINRMNDFALATPALRGARAARMLITSDNTSSARAALKGGYRVVSTLSFVDWEAPSKGRRPPESPSGYGRCSPGTFRKEAAESRLLKAQGGLVYGPFTGAFEPTLRAARAKKGWLFRSKALGPLMAGMFADTGERWMGIQAFAASEGAAKRAIDFAVERRAESATVILPAGERFSKPFLGSGFTRSEWAKKVNIWQKDLARSPRRATSSRAAAAPRRKAR